MLITHSADASVRQRGKGETEKNKNTKSAGKP